MMKKYEVTAKRIIKALNDNDMRAQDLVNATGISKASISQYVNGSHAPSNINAGKMGEVLRVSPLWLMGFDVSPNEDNTDAPSDVMDIVNQYGTDTPEQRAALSAALDAVDIPAEKRELIQRILRMEPEQVAAFLAMAQQMPQ